MTTPLPPDLKEALAGLLVALARLLHVLGGMFPGLVLEEVPPPTMRSTRRDAIGG